MASGCGVNGGPGRCYSFWLDFTKCLADSDIPSECKDARDDNLECLHHYKEGKRHQAIREQILIREQKEKEAAAAAKAAARKAAS